MGDPTNFINRLLFKFKGLTDLGISKTAALGNVMNAEKIYKFSPERTNFYMQLMESITNPDPAVVETVLKRENLTRTQRQDIQDKLNEIRRFWELQPDQTKTKAIDRINKKLGTNILTQGMQLKVATPSGQAGGAFGIDDLKQALFKPPPTQSTPLDQAFKELPTDEARKEVATKYQIHPIYSPTNENVGWYDRAIFIAITYVIRAIAIFFVEWGLFSGFIRTFASAFTMYFGMYLAIYGLFLFLVNSRDKDKLFRFLFFYANLDSEDGKGLMRIIVHILCIFMILPIPYVVKEYREYEEPNVLSFTDKSNILAGVDKFTLYAWILTSIVVLAL